MDKLLIVNKEKGYTSRDVVNIVSKVFNTKKVGHFGTLDPLATGVLVVGIGAFTKLCNYNLFDTKEYICDVLVGTSTDTYDITGKILRKEDILLTDEQVILALKHFKGIYEQEVPIYSAVKVNGKKLYEYARENKQVLLPKKQVNIIDIGFLSSFKKAGSLYFRFKCLVSKGTYIRSLVNDLSNYLKVPLCMSALVRTKQGTFEVESAYTVEDIKNNKYRLYDLEELIPITIIDNFNQKEILNGVKQLKHDNYKKLVLYKNGTRNIALYRGDIDPEYLKLFFFFKN